MKSLTRIFILLACCSMQALSGQNFDAWMSTYTESIETIPAEKLQIETDRDLYLAGEQVYFSVRIQPDNNFSQSRLSDIICVELTGPQNEIAGQKRIGADSFLASGQIPLSRDIISGYYTILAYTRWNRNFGNTFAAKKIIRVINAYQSGVAPVTGVEFPERPENNISIHPVCGKMLVHTNNRIIVKAFTKYLQPLTGRGIVYSASGDTLTSFNMDKTGLVSFELMPLPATGYYLQFITPSGDSLYRLLPEAVEGIGITSSLENDHLGLDIIKTMGCPVYEILNLIITRGNSIVFHKEGILPGENHPVVPVPDDPGVYSAFLLTDSMVVLAQSNFFIPPELKNIEVKPDNSNPSKREKVGVNVNVPEKETARSSYTLTVVKDLELLSGNHLSDWLDLFGGSMIPRVEQLNIPVQDMQSLVNLMGVYVHTLEPVMSPAEMTGITGKKPVILPEHGGEILSGTIRRRGSDDPVAGQIVVLSFNGESLQMFNTITDSAGRFIFHLRDILGTHQVTLCCFPPDDSKTILVDNHYAGTVSNELIPPLRFDESDRKDIEELFLAAQVAQEYRKEVVDEEQNNYLLSDNFYGEADFRLSMDRYVELPVMEEVFFELVKKVVVTKSREGSEIRVIDANVPRVIGDSPLILIDGVPFIRPEYVLALPPTEIKSINVVHYRYYLENLAFDGIVDIRTKRGEIRNDDLPPGAMNMEYTFMQKSANIYFPDYSAGRDVQERIPDFRNLLYWNPRITDWNNISFYTSDQQGRFRIIVKEFTEGRVTGQGTGMINVK